MLIKNPESSRAHRQYVRPNRFNEVATLENLESYNRFSVCSRSGGNGGFAALVDRKYASLNRADEALTPANDIDSIESAVCTRSGASRDSLSASDTQERSSCSEMIESTSVYRQCATPSCADDTMTLENLESHNRFSVCSRSGGNGGFAPIVDTKFRDSEIWS